MHAEGKDRAIESSLQRYVSDKLLKLVYRRDVEAQ